MENRRAGIRLQHPCIIQNFYKLVLKILSHISLIIVCVTLLKYLDSKR